MAAFFSVSLATGMLAIGFALAAMLQGHTVGDLYADIFPRYRGAGGATELPRYVYAIFFVYVVIAAELSGIFRRMLVKHR